MSRRGEAWVVIRRVWVGVPTRARDGGGIRRLRRFTQMKGLAWISRHRMVEVRLLAVLDVRRVHIS